ncbi:MAG TPA: arginine--tRNA ligase, partial [Burkholderiales bacterium]|nr:arginine--tRNA ligase [Burkholderiales bacterium]
MPPATFGGAPLPQPAVERSRDATHGDFACNIAMRLAKSLRANPRKLAEQIVAAIPRNDQIGRTEIAGPGFINFFLTPAAWQAELLSVHAAGAGYGRGNRGAGRRVIVEFVSANPTGPLHVG